MITLVMLECTIVVNERIGGDNQIYLNTKLQDLLVKPLSSDLAVDKTIEVDFLSLNHSLHPIKSEYHSLSSVDFRNRENIT